MTKGGKQGGKAFEGARNRALNSPIREGCLLACGVALECRCLAFWPYNACAHMCMALQAYAYA